MKKAEIIINGPKGQSFAEVECQEDGVIHPAYADAALAVALNHYNELPAPYSAIAFGKDNFDINPDRARLTQEG